jgi:hypothetical protein
MKINRLHIISALGCLSLAPIIYAASGSKIITTRGFESFSKGKFDDGGSNLYVNAQGVVAMIHTWDVNDDGYPDMILSNNHDHIERAPSRMFKVTPSAEGKDWESQELNNPSGWVSQVKDVDQDGHLDLVIVNAENGVTGELDSYLYWGSAEGITDDRLVLPTTGSYQVAFIDLNRDGMTDLVFSTAWVDHHNPGKLMPARVYLQEANRKFKEATNTYNIDGMAARSIAAADLNGDGFTDLVLANYREDFNVNIDSYVYWGTKDGIDSVKRVLLPTNGAKYVIVADLDRNGFQDVIFSGTGEVRVYWNRKGGFQSTDCTFISMSGLEESEFRKMEVQCAVGDLDQDGEQELVLASSLGLDILSASDLTKVRQRLPVKNLSWVSVADINGDGRPELIASRFSDDLSFHSTSPIFWNGPKGFSMDNVTWVPTQGAMGNSIGIFRSNGDVQVVYGNTKIGRVRGIQNHVYLGDKDFNYDKGRMVTFPTDGSNTSLFADLNQDGYTDAVFADRNIRITYGGPTGSPPRDFVELPSGPTLQDLQIADFDRDGYLDILGVCWVYDSTPESLARSGTIYYGSKNGFTDRRENIPMIGNAARTADVNRDGWLDIIFSEPHMNRLRIAYGSRRGYSADNIRFIPVVHPTRINVADLNADGWLDLIASEGGSRIRLDDSLQILYGGPEGYSEENSQKHMGGYYALSTAVADFNRDGHLDLFLPAYTTAISRTPPSDLFFGDGKEINLDRPMRMSTMAAAGAIQVDANRDGWIDLFVACHRDDVGHHVDSYLYWNGPEGFSESNKINLPGLGPHGTTSRDRGNAYNRKPEESYISEPIGLAGATLEHLQWQGTTPFETTLKFQLRWATTKDGLARADWHGPAGVDSYYMRSGEAVEGVPAKTAWIQYRAIFESPYGAGSPTLREVSMVLNTR